MKKLSTIVIVLLIVVVSTSCGSKKKEVVKEYDVSNLQVEFLETNNNAYEIGANKEGMPVFKDTDKAFDGILVDYEDGFDAIQKEFNLKTVSKKNYRGYTTYGWQLTTENKEITKQGIIITQFFDIYENSFE